MFDDSSSCELVRLNSNPLPSKEWEYCPENKEFLMKVRNRKNKLKTMVYTLKEGSPLPYKPNIEGIVYL